MTNGTDHIIAEPESLSDLSWIDDHHKDVKRKEREGRRAVYRSAGISAPPQALILLGALEKAGSNFPQVSI